MTDQPRPLNPEPAPDAPAPRRLVITFPADGSADCRIDPEGIVTPAHLYLAAWMLDAWAREVRADLVSKTRPKLYLADHLQPGGLQS